MDDREFVARLDPDETMEPLPAQTQPDTQGPSVNISGEGTPPPGETPMQGEPANPADMPAGSAPADRAAPQPSQSAQPRCADTEQPPADGPPCEPEMIVCPRCGNYIPFENFCPVCMLRLRGAPPAQTAYPPQQPYAGKIPMGSEPPAAYPWQAGAYAPPQRDAAAPRTDSADTMRQQPSPQWQGYAPSPPPYAGGYAPPVTSTPYLPPDYQRPQKPSFPRWMPIMGIVLGFLILLFLIIITGLLGYGIITNGEPNSYEPDSYGDYYNQPEGDYSGEIPLPDDILPQYFIGDTVVNNQITYDFDYCLAEQDEEQTDEFLIVVGVTFQNSSDSAFTLTPDLFRLEDATGNPCAYATDTSGVSAKDVLERTVLMPGEKISKLLLYSTSSGDYDYLPLYVLNPLGDELFYVYLTLYQ